MSVNLTYPFHIISLSFNNVKGIFLLGFISLVSNTLSNLKYSLKIMLLFAVIGKDTVLLYDVISVVGLTASSRLLFTLITTSSSRSAILSAIYSVIICLYLLFYYTLYRM